jgi:hypothetical protein
MILQSFCLFLELQFNRNYFLYLQTLKPLTLTRGDMYHVSCHVGMDWCKWFDWPMELTADEEGR